MIFFFRQIRNLRMCWKKHFSIWFLLIVRTQLIPSVQKEKLYFLYSYLMWVIIKCFCRWCLVWETKPMIHVTYLSVFSGLFVTLAIKILQVKLLRKRALLPHWRICTRWKTLILRSHRQENIPNDVKNILYASFLLRWILSYDIHYRTIFCSVMNVVW